MRSAWLLTLVASALHGATILIRVVDGRNGKAVARERVVFWIDKMSGAARDAKTDPDGVATIEAPAGARLITAFDVMFDCRPFKRGTPRPSYAVDEILSSGVVAGNTCGKVRGSAKPGEILFFVRPVHWWEGMRW